MVRVAIRAVMATQPELTHFGFGVYDEGRITDEEWQRKYTQGRGEMLTNQAADEFERAFEYLQLLRPRKALDKTTTSYGLKHNVERYHDRHPNLGRIGGSYVANGMLIAAAYHLSLKVQRESKHSPNAYLNVSSESIESLKTERPSVLPSNTQGATFPIVEGQRRLTDAERREWPKRFQMWMPPDAMMALWDNVHETVGVSMMYQAGVDFMRNAWTAAHFAKARGAQEVRLCTDTRPDFEMKLHGQHTLFEVTEAGNFEGRGNEYRAFDERRAVAVAAGETDYVEVEDDPVEDWIARADQAPALLQSAAIRKANGNYDPSFGLVIYLNIGEYGLRQKEIEGCMRAATAPAKGKFREVWVLWKGQAYQTS